MSIWRDSKNDWWRAERFHVWLLERLFVIIPYSKRQFLLFQFLLFQFIDWQDEAWSIFKTCVCSLEMLIIKSTLSTTKTYLPFHATPTFLKCTYEKPLRFFYLEEKNCFWHLHERYLSVAPCSVIWSMKIARDSCGLEPFMRETSESLTPLIPRLLAMLIFRFSNLLCSSFLF